MKESNEEVKQEYDPRNNKVHKDMEEILKIRFVLQ